MAQLSGPQEISFEPRDSIENEENFEVFIGTRWNVYKVTQLYKFQYTEARLKQYAVRLREKLPYDEENKGVRYKAAFAALPEVKPSDDAPDPVQITVESIVGEDNGRLLYNGILISYKRDPHQSQLKDCVYLPLLLCRGGDKIKDYVHKVLCEFFDCYIKKVCFERNDLLWMLGLSVHFHTAGSGNVALSFTLPGCEYKNAVDCTIQLTELKSKWKRIFDDGHVGITHDKIIKLKTECFEEIEHTYGINLSILQLKRIRLRDFLVTDNGHLKFSREIATILLQFLHERATSNEIYW